MYLPSICQFLPAMLAPSLPFPDDDLPDLRVGPLFAAWCRRGNRLQAPGLTGRSHRSAVGFARLVEAVHRSSGRGEFATETLRKASMVFPGRRSKAPELGVCRVNSCQFVEQSLCLFEVGSVKSFAEPAINRRQQLAASSRRPSSRHSRARLVTAGSSHPLAFCYRAMAIACRRLASTAWSPGPWACNSSDARRRSRGETYHCSPVSAARSSARAISSKPSE